MIVNLVMKKYHHIIHKEAHIESTVDFRSYIGARVISKNGEIVGKIKGIRVSSGKMSVEGFVVSCGGLRRDLYIGRSYVERFSDESFILNIDLSILLNGKVVVTSDGKKVGQVYRVVRKENTNEIDRLIVRSFLIMRFSIVPDNIKYIGDSIILKPNYEVKKKYFWKEVR